VSRKARRGKPSLRSIAARKGWATRRANIAHAKRVAAAKKGWETRRHKARSEAAKKGHRTRRENARKLAFRGAPQGGVEGDEDFTEVAARPRESAGGGDNQLYGIEADSGEPEWQDFDGWDYDDFDDDGLDSDADDDGDTGGESAKT
jgi:hypothetical protein